MKDKDFDLHGDPVNLVPISWRSLSDSVSREVFVSQIPCVGTPKGCSDIECQVIGCPTTHTLLKGN